MSLIPSQRRHSDSTQMATFKTINTFGLLCSNAVRSSPSLKRTCLRQAA